MKEMAREGMGDGEEGMGQLGEVGEQESSWSPVARGASGLEELLPSLLQELLPCAAPLAQLGSNHKRPWAQGHTASVQSCRSRGVLPAVAMCPPRALPAHAPIQGVHHDRSGVRHLPLYQRLPCLGGFLQPSHADGLLGAIISPVQVVPHPVHSDPFHIVDTFGEKQEHELGNSRKTRSGGDGPIK